MVHYSSAIDKPKEPIVPLTTTGDEYQDANPKDSQSVADLYQAQLSGAGLFDDHHKALATVLNMLAQPYISPNC